MKLIFAALLAATPPSAQSPDIVSLLATSAADLRAHQSPIADVRHVHAGQLKNQQSGATQLLICGEILQARATDAQDWIAFATIKMDDYEQWIGPSSDMFCKSPTVSWYPDIDLTADMKHDLGLK